MRDKDQTKQKILQAVGKLIAEGNGKAGVNAVAREAGVDKVLIYRYFGGMPELLRAYVSEGEFWPGFEDVMETSPYVAAMLPPGEIGTRFVHGFIRELRSRPVTLEILRRELQETNALTAELTRVRDDWTRDIGESYAGRGGDPEALHALVTAGLIYLMLAGKTMETFCGVDVRTDEGWERIERAAGRMFERMKDEAERKLET